MSVRNSSYSDMATLAYAKLFFTLTLHVSQKNKKLCTKDEVVFINGTSFCELLRTSSGRNTVMNKSLTPLEIITSF